MTQSPPYPPRNWSLGGLATKSTDIPITSVFLFLYICLAATHMTIFQLNKRRGHKFLFNGALFGFCMSRIVTNILRLASITHPHNIRLAIAAQIFVAAGVLIVFVINLLWTQRIVRALHPSFGWSRGASFALKPLWVLIFLTLAALITTIVQSFYTLRPRTLFIDRAVQLYGVTFMAVIAFLPLPILAIAFAVPRKYSHERFGTGSLRTKVAVLVTGALLLSFGASYRAGTTWMPPVSRHEPMPAYFNKAALYCVDFGVEVLTVGLYAVTRVDLRFHVPDGAKGPGSYTKAKIISDEEEK
ncbi:hypothetical protein E8E13_005162 [Curvularia kusanoi]|uniref:Uncharacterized protein n=1 Tax=Curvularia kusanoi TaxID=90978 RepID=A0A9P4TK33_CURKU|nr:hypothetical protein E8E13_005162 [Curvularia kusanoi]